MEEKKDNKATIASLGKQQEAPKEERYSYEQLTEICIQLEQQNQYLTKQLYLNNQANMYKHLEYLFKAVEFADTIKDPEFINACIAEIKNIMTVPEENKKDTSEGKEA